VTQRLRGLITPVLTPFDADLAPDATRLIEHCKWLLTQCSGLALFGTTSEANSMAPEERVALLDAVIAAGCDPSRMMPGTGCCSFMDTVRLTRHAVQHGCAGVLMLPPFYYKGVSDEGLYRYYSEVVERVGERRLRIYLYHIPPVTAVGITTTLVERLLKAYPGTIAGMKDSSGKWANTQAFLKAFTAEGFDVFTGNENFLLATMRHGGAGCISATANINAAAIRELCAEWDGAAAEAQQVRLNLVREAVDQNFPMLAALKSVVAAFRNDPAWTRVRPPLVELSVEQATALAAELEYIGFTLPALAPAAA
jgi:4-hydroxy-tetrahydrodipicolinate synthase